MKKFILIVLFLFIAAGIWIYLNKNSTPQTQTSVTTQGTNQSSSIAQQSTPVFSTNVALNVAEQTNKPLNALTATNLEQWKQAVKDLTQLGGFKYNQDWIMEQKGADGHADKNLGRPFILSQNGRSVICNVTFLNVDTKNGSENLLEAELQTPNMNIDETRELGVQLCKLIGQDPTEFLAWCDKVGNHWLDAPLYGTKSNAPLSFKILMTYNNDKPWCIDLAIGYP